VSSAILVAPATKATERSGDIVGFNIENNTSQAITAHTITFGQVFVDGDVPSGSSLIATIDGQQYVVQMDAKTRYPDGSVRTAGLTITAPALAAKRSVQAMLSKTTVASTVAAIGPNNFAAQGYDTNVTLTFHNGEGSTSTQTINAAQALVKALSAGTARTWLHGSQATEVRVDVAINNSLHIALNIRGNADATFMTDVQLANDNINSADCTTYTYDVSIASHGQTAFSQSHVQHAPLQEWHQQVWSTASGVTQAPPDYVAYNVDYLETAGAISGYDTLTGVAASMVESAQSDLATKHTGLLGAAAVTQYQGMTGGRPDIGPTTKWASDWLVSQNQLAEQVMMANAQAIGSEPFHAVNADGSLADSDSNPTLWIDYRNTSSAQATKSILAGASVSGWTLNGAHIPDLAYIPALTQGSEYYIKQLQDQANFDLMGIMPGFRNNFVDLCETRADAWFIRDLANAAYALPDGSPRKPYFTRALKTNIDYILSAYVHGAKGRAEGALYGYINALGSTNVGPWQAGFLAIEMAHAAKLGFAGAAEVAAWQNHFITGLFVNGANGFSPLEGTVYYLSMGTPDASQPDRVRHYTTWAQAYSATLVAQFGTPSYVPTALDTTNGAEPAILRAATASLWDVLDDPDDLAAYAFLTQHTPSMAASYVQDNTWNITPTLPDGHHLRNSEVYYGNGGTTTAASSNGLLAAVSGDNVLNAGNGDSILIGGPGNDALSGGGGRHNFLFAGTGVQTLYAGPGTNYLEGGSVWSAKADVDTFVFKVSDAAHDTVAHFRPSSDALQIGAGSSGITAASLVSGATTDAAGNAVLHLSANHDTILQGIKVDQIDPTHIHIVASPILGKLGSH
jgi:hypothetical protein